MNIWRELSNMHPNFPSRRREGLESIYVVERSEVPLRSIKILIYRLLLLARSNIRGPSSIALNGLLGASQIEHLKKACWLLRRARRVNSSHAHMRLLTSEQNLLVSLPCPVSPPSPFLSPIFLPSFRPSKVSPPTKAPPSLLPLLGRGKEE